MSAGGYADGGYAMLTSPYATRYYYKKNVKELALPLITKVDQEMRDQLLNLDYRAGKLYQLFTPVEQDLKHPPIIIN